MCVATPVQLHLVGGDGLQEYLLIGGDLTKPSVDAHWYILDNPWGMITPRIYIEWLVTRFSVRSVGPFTEEYLALSIIGRRWPESVNRFYSIDSKVCHSVYRSVH